MEDQAINDKPIWRDEDTGLPMHSHSRPVIIDGFILLKSGEHRPCTCGNKACDVPLSAVQSASPRKEY